MHWLNTRNLTSIGFQSPEKDPKTKEGSYINQKNIRGAQVIGGAICELSLDLTHPLCYGFESSRLPVFRNSTLFMKPPLNLAESPLRYTDRPLISGYMSDQNLNQLKNTAAVQVNRIGKGHIIAMTDNPNFRAFWWGTNKVFMNAIFFGPIIE